MVIVTLQHACSPEEKVEEGKRMKEMQPVSISDPPTICVCVCRHGPLCKRVCSCMCMYVVGGGDGLHFASSRLTKVLQKQTQSLEREWVIDIEGERERGRERGRSELNCEVGERERGSGRRRRESEQSCCITEWQTGERGLVTTSRQQTDEREEGRGRCRCCCMR